MRKKLRSSSEEPTPESNRIFRTPTAEMKSEWPTQVKKKMKKEIRENSQIYECVQNAALALVGELVIKDEKYISEIEPNVIAEHLAKILETRPITTLH